ncbi:F0F1 ATP synthase subunit delta [Luteolibacter pohnpeiensis]|uniref:ATP synthase subunit b n=1 Tax=Luteolibacter pohnpeiensis TaxID=454153 RepID=A0A934VWZ6_9BACT|nr:F0F1 ATP synthase subunit delta [Luteolibacter pohnpeiensis]MBK1883039.1 F0F1 ATP synthase subunit delta [Luteolibacter pohnpeiensis]
MLIDWFTVCAQALNFLVLVWLLRKFLYQPVMQAIDGREKRIAAELADADAKRTAAQAARDEFERKNTSFDQERTSLMAKAATDAEELRKKLQQDVANEATERRAKWRESLVTEQQTLKETLIEKTRDEVFAISRKTLADLADSTLEASIAHVLVKRMKDLGAAEKSILKTALETDASPIVRSAFELPNTEQAAIQNAFRETFSNNLTLRFEVAPDLISGIEITTEGQKIAWSIDGYLTTLEQSVDALMKPAAGAAA